MPGNLITLATFDNVPLSEVARLRLEAAGIPARVENANIVNTLWHLGPALGGVRLIVDAEHAAEAQALIADIRQSLLLTPGGGEDHAPPQCLACGAEFPADAVRCAACGWSFNDSAASDESESARIDDSPHQPKLAQVREIGLPFVAVWVAASLAGIVLGFLGCALSMLKDVFK